MPTAREIMDPKPLTTSPSVGVTELAAQLLAHPRAEGACVLDHGVLVGVVTQMDLIFKEKQVHVPSFITILDAVIPLESPQVLRDELRKIAGLTVAELMSVDPVTVGPDTPASQVATEMVEHGYSIVPVLQGDTLLGAVTRSSLLRAVYPEAP